MVALDLLDRMRVLANDNIGTGINQRATKLNLVVVCPGIIRPPVRKGDNEQIRVGCVQFGNVTLERGDIDRSDPRLAPFGIKAVFIAV